MSHILIEACCGSAEDALMAEKGGADRIELNSSLVWGGLTPSAGTLETVKNHVSIPVLCMLRPRGGGFYYSEPEFECMLRDTRALLRAGADGFVCGCLRADQTVDTERMKRVTDAADGKPVVFHRAMDVLPDWRSALEELIRIGIPRVLTSGQSRTALEGAETIRQMREAAGGRITILPGCGIRAENAAEVIRLTGCDQIHLSGGHTMTRDETARNDRGISFRGELPEEEIVPVTDADYFRRLRNMLD